MRIAGLVVAGGQGRRMGGEKAFVPFGHASLIDAVIARVRVQVDILAVNIRDDMRALYQSHFGNTYPFVPDSLEIGPLGGVLAGLEWTMTEASAEWLATFPCDTPFLPSDLVARLVHAVERDQHRPAVIIEGSQVQNLCALWPVQCLRRLKPAVVNDGLRSVWQSLELLDAQRVVIESAPYAFFNVNTPEDLVKAEHIAERDCPSPRRGT